MKLSQTALPVESWRTQQINRSLPAKVAVGVFDARSLSYATGCLVASFVAKLGFQQISEYEYSVM